MIPKHRAPTHPGKILLEEFLKPAGVSQGQLVKRLGGRWSQPKVSQIVNGRRRITTIIAMNFSDVFGTSPEFWLNLQNEYDIWHEREAKEQDD